VIRTLRRPRGDLSGSSVAISSLTFRTSVADDLRGYYGEAATTYTASIPNPLNSPEVAHDNVEGRIPKLVCCIITPEAEAFWT